MVQGPLVFFDRPELDLLLQLYGRFVAAGEWRDYAIDGLADRAIFWVFKSAHEHPLYGIEKCPALARKQGAFCIYGRGDVILKRGHELKPLLHFFDRRRFSVIEP